MKTAMQRSLVFVLGLTLAACAGESAPPDSSAVQHEGLPPGIVSKEDPTTFMEAVGKIDATPAFFEAFAKRPDPGPTINLNVISSASIDCPSRDTR